MENMELDNSLSGFKISGLSDKKGLMQSTSVGRRSSYEQIACSNARNRETDTKQGNGERLTSDTEGIRVKETGVEQRNSESVAIEIDSVRLPEEKLQVNDEQIVVDIAKIQVTGIGQVNTKEKIIAESAGVQETSIKQGICERITNYTDTSSLRLEKGEAQVKKGVSIAGLGETELTLLEDGENAESETKESKISRSPISISVPVKVGDEKTKGYVYNVLKKEISNNSESDYSVINRSKTIPLLKKGNFHITKFPKRSWRAIMTSKKDGFLELKTSTPQEDREDEEGRRQNENQREGKMAKHTRRLSIARLQAQLKLRTQKFENKRLNLPGFGEDRNELSDEQTSISLSDYDAFSRRPSALPSPVRHASIDSQSSNVPFMTEDLFKYYERKNLGQQKEIKKKFRASIAEAKKTLLEARILAQEQTAAKRFEEASRKHRSLQRLRAARRDEESTSPGAEIKSQKHVLRTQRFKQETLTAEMSKKNQQEMREVRKVQSEMDRAKAKRLQTLIKLQTNVHELVKTEASTVDPNIKVKLRKRKDSERIERYEVECLISELRCLNLHDYAKHLLQTLRNKDEMEVNLREELRNERKRMADLAKKQKQEEQERLREEERQRKLQEKERLAREKREREEEEKKRRKEEAVKRREHNMKFWDSYTESVLATEITRSFTFSFLPALKQNKKKDKEEARELPARLKTVESRYMQSRHHNK
ncbi:trichohyalin [Nematostella vectensis]|uniref:trichohyalin n=1 Tax=Nematostella vectensis TaxID=45351 RepID=UPI00207712DF|nr:trichohyalin [Nematostella vectensis]